MMRICHVVDDGAGYEHRIAVTQLVQRLPSERFESRVAAISRELNGFLGHLEPQLHPKRLLCAHPFLSRFTFECFARREQIDLVHAWGVKALDTSRTGRDIPVVLTVFDPGLSEADVKRVRACESEKGFAIACASQRVRQRLIERGVSKRACVVVRPGVDFKQIGEVRRGDGRMELGVAKDQMLVCLPEPVSVRLGSFEAFLGVAMRQRVQSNIRVIVPGRSSQADCIEQFIYEEHGGSSEMLIRSEDDWPMEEVIALSDVMVVLPRSDISTTCLAWAMASRTAIVATATYAVAEMVSHGLNGLLLKPEKRLSTAVSRAVVDHKTHRKVIETAYGHAYEMFKLSRYVWQMQRLYENIRTGVEPREGIEDPAYTM